jgi:cyclic pyranopterin phosphate synthase
MNEQLSHIDSHGKATMVDVSNKVPMVRTAIARCLFHARETTLDAIMNGDLPKGEGLSVARIAGIQAAKQCGALIPLCHPLPLEFADVRFERMSPDCIAITAAVKITSKTGIEMEALVAVSIAALTLWDMTKAIDATLLIDGITLIEKRKEEVG